MIFVDVIILIIGDIIGDLIIGYEIIGMVDFNIIIEVWNLDGIIIGIMIMDD